MRKCRVRWIVVGVSVLGLGIVGVLLLRPRIVPIPAPTEPIVEEEGTTPPPWEELPSLGPDSTVEAEKPTEAEETAEKKPERKTLPVGYVQVGRLVYEMDGKRVAEETYRLARRPEGVEIVSSGSFSVKVLFLPVTVNFSQEISLDSDFRPRRYRLEARGPLGFGNQKVSISVESNRATVAVGDEVRTVAVPAQNAFFLGTPAAYVILPALHAAWAEGDKLVLVPVSTGEGPGTPSGAAAGKAEVTRGGTVAVEMGGGMVLLDRHRIRAGNFAGTLLARGPEFVAFLGEGERTFTAYRADLFPRGIRLSH